MEPKEKCENCLENGHSKSQCPHPTWCVGCKDRGHNRAKCPKTITYYCENCERRGHSKFQCPRPAKCLRCGSPGHLASDCPTPPWCTNCKQEGHLPFQCPLPAKCINCQKEGHKIRDCPLLLRCLRCDSEDHFTRNCPEFPAWCSSCKQIGHRGSDCPHPRRCSRCGEKGHTSGRCPNANKKSASNGDLQPKQVSEVTPVSAPCHQYRPPGPAPVPAPRRMQVGNVVKKKDDELKMRQDEEQLRAILFNNVQKSGYSILGQFLLKIVPTLQVNKVDVMTCSHAKSQSGHTAALLVPIISMFMEENIIGGHPEESSRPVKPHCVVITPTRESAAQISTLAKMFTDGTNIRVAVTSGDTSVEEQMEDARRGCNILISTPGRLLYFVKENVISYESLKVLILDEADRLISDDFKACVEKIVTSETMPRIQDRQTYVHCKKFDAETPGRVKSFMNKSYIFLDEEQLENIEVN